MTFEKTKDLLEDLKSARLNAIKLKRRLDELKGDYEGLCLHSQLGNMQEIHTASNESIVVRVVIKIDDAINKWTKALEKVLDLEDSLNEAIQTLTPTEQDIIIGFYMEDKTHEQLSRECNYCEKQTRRIKNTAIFKLSKII